MCDIYGKRCHEGHKSVSMHNADFTLPRDVVLAVYCPDCRKPDKPLVYEEGGWAIRYSIRALTSRLWSDKIVEEFRRWIDGQRAIFKTQEWNWALPGGDRKMTLEQFYGTVLVYEKAQRDSHLKQLAGALELDQRIEIARCNRKRRGALAEFLGGDTGWAAFNGDPNEMSEDDE